MAWPIHFNHKCSFEAGLIEAREHLTSMGRLHLGCGQPPIRHRNYRAVILFSKQTPNKLQITVEKDLLTLSHRFLHTSFDKIHAYSSLNDPNIEYSTHNLD